MKHDQIQLRKLADKLSTVDSIVKHDRPNDSEAWAMAISFADIQESFETINSELLPKVLQANDSEEITAALVDIGDEFRHILFHIYQMRFYETLKLLHKD